MNFNFARTMLSVAAGALLALSGAASHAQPRWGAESSPSPSTSTSQKANEAADRAVYKPIEYSNASKAGPPLIVIPGEIKSNNATFVQKFGANNIADFAEIELSKANFAVLERTNLGPLLNEFTLAYNLGDPDGAQRCSAAANSRPPSGWSNSTFLKPSRSPPRKKASTALPSAA